MAMPRLADLVNKYEFSGASGNQCSPNCKFSRISSGVVTSTAPCLINQCGPFIPGFPDRARQGKHFLPCSRAQRAVTSEPLRKAASTTSTPLLRPLI